MGKFSYTCSQCGQDTYFEHPGPRKPGLWLFAVGTCEHCQHREILRTYDGEEEPRKLSQKSQELQVFILSTFHREEPPLTIRHVFYVCANHRKVTKDLSGYRAVIYQIGLMRKAGTLPYSWVADNSRTIYKPIMYNSAAAALDEMQNYFRRDLWASQSEYVEIWVEKDAMAGVLNQVTNRYGVPLYVARGYSSDQFIWQSAEAIREIGKPTTIYQFGDFDYDGVAAAHNIHQKLDRDHGVKVNFERVAVTNEQIQLYDLPTRPPKLPGDNAPKGRKDWAYDYCVDLDAMPAQVVRKLVEDCITRHIEPYTWARAKQIEEQERIAFAEMAKNFRTSTKVFA